MQVALLVAAEFWEQGDLEISVLQQQPIVSIPQEAGNLVTPLNREHAVRAGEPSLITYYSNKREFLALQ